MNEAIPVIEDDDERDALSDSIRVLHVDDEEMFTDLVSEMLEREDDRFDVETAASASEALDRLEATSFDGIVSDYEMPGTNGIEFLTAVRERYPDLPFILYTGKGSETIASEAISAGVTDYLQKTSGREVYELLANRLENAVSEYRAKQRAAESERRLVELTETTKDVLWMFTADLSEVLVINSAYETLWGRSIEALRADPTDFLKGIHPDDRAGVKEALADLSEGHSREMEFRVNAEEGYQRWVWVQGEPIYHDADEPVRIAGFVRDITERREQQQELRRSERQFRALFNDPNLLVGLLETDGTVLDVNGTAMEYVDVDTDDVTGEPFWETPWWSSDQESQAMIRRKIRRAAAGEYVKYEGEFAPPGGAQRSIVGVVRPVRDETGDVVSLIVSALDVTDRAETERKLRQESERLAEHNRTLRRLYEISASQNATFEEKIQQVLDLGREHLGMEGGFVTSVSMDDDRWTIEHESGMDDRFGPGSVVPFARPFCRQVVTGESALEITDTTANGWDGGPESEQWEYDSILGGVVQRNGEVTGTLCFVSRTSRDSGFTVTERTFVDLACQWLGCEHNRMERERQLQQYREYTNELLDSLEDLFFVLDADGCLKRWNESLSAVTDYTEEELAGMHATEFFDDGQTDVVNTAITKTFETGCQRIEVPLMTAGGEKVPYEFSGTRVADPDGGPSIAGIGRDITERRAYEQRLKTECDRFSALFENASHEVAHVELTTDDVRILSVNDQFAETFGVDKDEIGETSLITRIIPPDEREKIYENIDRARAGDHLEREVRRQTTDGERIFHTQFIPIGSDEPVEEGFAVYMDITERKRREEELKRTNERLEEFASVVSHDLRSPLAVAEGRLALAREAHDSDHLQSVSDSLDRMGTMIDDLLTMAREGSRVGDLEAVDLAETVRESWANVESADATLAVETALTVRADPGRLRQLLGNLFRNAIEHGGETVRVTVGAFDDGFYVKDDGPGITPTERAKVFESGYSTVQKHTGFGLAIVRGIADAHGWTVTIGDREGGGARFEVTGVDIVQ